MSFLTVLSGIVGLVGTFAQAGAARSAGEAEAAAGNYNAAVLEQQAKADRDAASAEAEDVKRRNMAQVSSNRAGRLASGITMAGSPLMVDEATVREVALGVSRTLHAGEVKAVRHENEATLNRMRASYASQAGETRAGATLLTGISRFGGQAASLWG